MKILVFSSTPWNTDNSFGSSYSNLFEGIENIEFANIYTSYGFPKNNLNAKYFQIVEKLLLKNLFDRSIKTGRFLSSNNEPVKLSDQEFKIVNNAKKMRWRIFFWARRLIWEVGRWKSNELRQFINDFGPELIFIPLYHSTHLNKIILYLKNFTGVKMVGYVSDDIYTLKQYSLSPFYWIDRLINRKTIKRTISECEFIYVISEIQKKDYEKIFKKECKILTKGANFETPQFKTKNNSPLKLVYTGNIGAGRWQSLASVAKVLAEINKNKIIAQLYIYSLTPMTQKMQTALTVQDSVFLMGGVPSEKIPAIQTDADVLVHVEPTNLKGRLQVRQSFSTKIVDYFYAARCIFAVGWGKAASIDYLVRNDAAIVATDENAIQQKLNQIIENTQLVKDYAQKAWNCGKRNHQIDMIQKSLYNDLKNLTTGKE